MRFEGLRPGSGGGVRGAFLSGPCTYVTYDGCRLEVAPRCQVGEGVGRTFSRGMEPPQRGGDTQRDRTRPSGPPGPVTPGPGPQSEHGRRFPSPSPDDLLRGTGRGPRWRSEPLWCNWDGPRPRLRSGQDSKSDPQSPRNRRWKHPSPSTGPLRTRPGPCGRGTGPLW